MRRFFLVVGVIFTLASCDGNIKVGEMVNMPGYWEKTDVVEFEIPQLDSLQRYHVFIHLRNTNEYPFNNIYLIASMEFPHGKTITDTLEYRMANADGSWLGEGIGSVKESKLWYKENVSFFEEGTYKLKVSQAVRNNGEVRGVSRLEGISDVGYSIEEANQQN